MAADAPARADARREPKQQRSRANYDAILTAAEDLVITDGLDALTTTRVAERAGVAVGTLYQYFPGVEGIVDRLVDRCVDEFAVQLGASLEGRRLTRKRDAANVALDSFVEYYRTSPLIQVLRTDSRTTAVAWASNAGGANAGPAPVPGGRQILDVVSSALIRQDLATADDEDFVLEMEVQWAVAQALIPLAFSRSADGDPAVLEHLRRLFDLDVRP